MSTDIDTQLASAKDRLLTAEAALKEPGSHAALQDWWSVTNAMTTSVAVLLFGLLVLFLATCLIRLGKSYQAVLRVFGTILIITVSVFLVVAGYNSNQIAPVMGLLGTIAGYLLGKDTEPSRAAEKQSSQ
jgi:uncharacterized membrane protein